MMNFFILTLSEKHFSFPSILNDSFAGYSNLGCRPLPFMTWNTSCQPLLACKDSNLSLCYPQSNWAAPALVPEWVGLCTP